MTEQMIQVEATASLRLPFGVELHTSEPWLIGLAIVAATAVVIVLGLRLARWWTARLPPL